MSEYREIRKYANRRLYDLHRSRYINRDDLRELITEGNRVRIIDDVSGDDITRSLLLQLLAEQELDGRPVLSDAVLTELIRFYDHPMQAVLGRYLQDTIEAFIDQHQRLQESLENAPVSGFSRLAASGLQDWLAIQRQFIEATIPKKRRR